MLFPVEVQIQYSTVCQARRLSAPPNLKFVFRTANYRALYRINSAGGEAKLAALFWERARREEEGGQKHQNWSLTVPFKDMKDSFMLG